MWLASCLTIATNNIFEACQLVGPYRAASMHATGSNANLGPHSKLSSISKLRRGINHYDGAVHFADESLCRRTVFGDDAVGMVGTISGNMVNSGLNPVDNTYRNDAVQIFSRPVIR